MVCGSIRVSRHDIAEILLEVPLNTIHQLINQSIIDEGKLSACRKLPTCRNTWTTVRVEYTSIWVVSELRTLVVVNTCSDKKKQLL